MSPRCKHHVEMIAKLPENDRRRTDYGLGEKGEWVALSLIPSLVSFVLITGKLEGMRRIGYRLFCHSFPCEGVHNCILGSCLS
jgi:hypothetical protein